jgi:hypothetical protein
MGRFSMKVRLKRPTTKAMVAAGSITNLTPAHEGMSMEGPREKA